mmetsp:Transcript_8457/g.14197  ORF Transcript_8457/g.14197 Transcript_8457/m.14197 type:complete len:240 (+) Transcript_8457:284-1003(+)
MVIFMHCMLNAADVVELSDRDAMEKKDGISKCMSQLGMPLFFYISGIGASFFDTRKKGYLIFVSDKIQRLLLPMLLAILFLLIPRLYLSQEYEAWTRVGDEVEPNFLKYLVKVLPVVNSRLSWLWFLIVLFDAMLIVYPFLGLSQRRREGLQVGWADAKLAGGLGVTLGAWALLSSLSIEEPELRGLYLSSLTVLASYFLVLYLLQLLIVRGGSGYKLAMFGKLVGPIFCGIMNSLKQG